MSARASAVSARPPAESGSGVDRFEPLAWVALLAPFAVLMVLALAFDRDDWPTPLGDEAVYLMAAQSIAYDLDLRYSSGDLARFEETFQRRPDGLILQSPDDGRTLVYGKPLLYPLAVAPFLRLLPQSGPATANFAYLLVACLLVVRALRPLLGGMSPLFVSAFVFGSLAFDHVFWAHSDLFLMSLVASGLALTLAPWLRRSTRPPGTYDAVLRRGADLELVVGCLALAAAVLLRPYYLPILLAPVVAATARRRRLIALVTLAAAALAFVGLNLVVRGEWSSYTGERQAFYSYSGFPGESPGETAPEGDRVGAGDTVAWEERVEELGGNAWTGAGLFPFPFEARQTGWNIVYLFLGRHVGVVPYFLPFLLGFLAFRADRVNWSLLAALVAVAALFLVARPFNFYGGGGSLGNRYLLPVYPLCWFLVRRRIHPVWPVLTVVLAAPFLWPSWSDPGAFWRRPDGSFTHVSRFAERVLPYESTQNHLKPSDREDFLYQVPGGEPLWMKPLSPRIQSPDGGATLLLAPGDRTSEVLVATEAPMRAFRITLDDGDERVARFRRPSARHRMWWTFDDLYLYRFPLDDGTPAPTSRLVRIVPVPR